MGKTLREILSALPGAVLEAGDAGQDPPIAGLRCDSRQAAPGTLFFCLTGTRADGRRFALSAYRGGCRAFIVERRAEDLPPDALQYRVPDARAALADAAACFYDHPERTLRLVGVTGTKGKTTTALLLRGLLEDAGCPAGCIGTNGAEFAGQRIETANTTPESLEIYRLLALMREAGARAAALEVSSQALYMGRTRGLAFDTCVFTNLSPDHIGGAEHPDFAHYRDCKRRLFTDHPLEAAVVSADDPASAYMTAGLRVPILSFSAGDDPAPGADYAARDLRPVRRAGRLGMSFSLFRRGARLASDCFLPLPGTFNVRNALGALAVAAERFGADPVRAAERLACASVPGRFETVSSPALPGAIFVIDYAHNGASLAAILEALRPYTERRLICLFGSVGGRTKGRRADLARAAAGRADLCVLTSDDPGPESAEGIMAEIDAAFPEGACPRLLIPDRAEAVRAAVNLAEPGDVVLLAGKGRETRQIVGTRAEPYSERAVLEDALRARGAAPRQPPSGEEPSD